MNKPPLRLLIGFSPGSASDIVARMLCQPLGARLGREVRVEPHPGADGRTAAMMLSRSVPDGDTLLVATLGTHALAQPLRVRLQASHATCRWPWLQAHHWS